MQVKVVEESIPKNVFSNYNDGLSFNLLAMQNFLCVPLASHCYITEVIKGSNLNISFLNYAF
jgi:hypothetical protein